MSIQTAQTFEAAYPGYCRTCREKFEAGDEVGYGDDGLAHAECLDGPGTNTIPEPEPCTRCWLTSCDCEKDT